MHALRAAFAAATIAAIACASAEADPSTLKLKLYAQNRPGETGTVTFEQIPSGLNGKYVIDIHESSADIKRYVASGAISMPK
jgi:hypothetical protein